MPVRPAMNTQISAGRGPSGSHTRSPRISVSSAPPSGRVTAISCSPDVIAGSGTRRALTGTFSKRRRPAACVIGMCGPP